MIKQTVSVTTDEVSSPKLAVRNSGNRRDI